MYSISAATSPQALKVAQDTLAIDRVKAQEDQANAVWQIKIAEDQAKMAMDKLAVDNKNAIASALVAADHLKTAQDNVKIAQDTYKVAIDSLGVLSSIDIGMGGTGAAGAVTSDQAQLAADQAQSAIDAGLEAAAQASASNIAGQGNQLLANDQNQTTTDQAGSASSDQGYQLTLAGLQGTKMLDSLQTISTATTQTAASASSTAANTTAANTLLQNQVNAMAEQRDAYRDLASLLAQGVNWQGVGGNFNDVMNQLGLQVHTNK